MQHQGGIIVPFKETSWFQPPVNWSMDTAQKQLITTAVLNIRKELKIDYKNAEQYILLTDSINITNHEIAADSYMQKVRKKEYVKS